MKNSKRNFKKGAALLLALATIATTIPTNGLWADTISDENTSVESNSVDAPATSELKEEILQDTDAIDESKSIKASPVSNQRVLYVKLSDGGVFEVSSNIGVLKVQKSDGKVYLSDDNSTIQDVSNTEINGYYPILSVDDEEVVQTKVTAENGYKIEQYSKLIDSGEESLGDFKELSVGYDYELSLVKDEYLSVSFSRKEEEKKNDTVETTKEDIEKTETEIEDSIYSDVPEDDSLYQKNNDGTWDYDTFPVVEESKDEGTVVLGPDGAEYPVKYLTATENFNASTYLAANLAAARATAGSTSSIQVTKGPQDTSNGKVTNSAILRVPSPNADGAEIARGICVTGKERFPTNQVATARHIDGSSANRTQRLLIAALLSNPNATARKVTGYSDDTADVGTWTLGGNGDNTSNNPHASWLMALHIVGSRIMYGTDRYAPEYASQTALMVNPGGTLDNYINVHKDLVDASILTLLEFGGGYQTIATVEVDTTTTVKFTKTIDGKTSGKDFSGCTLSIYDSLDKAKKAVKAANNGTAIPTGRTAKIVLNKNGSVNTSESTSGYAHKLQAGKTYYAVETTAPKDAELYGSYIKHKMKAGETWEIDIDDESKTGDPVGVRIMKVSKVGDGDTGSVVIPNAVFHVRYYNTTSWDDAHRENGVDWKPATNVWHIKTNSQGVAQFRSTCSEDYCNDDCTIVNNNVSNGGLGYQPGIYRITEAKAPSGFGKLSGDLIILARVDSDGNFTWTHVARRSSDDYKEVDYDSKNNIYTGSISDMDEDGSLTMSEIVKYYSFEFVKMDLLKYYYEYYKEGDSKWSSIKGKPLAGSNFDGITFDVVNMSGCAKDKEIYDNNLEPVGATWRGKHPVFVEGDGSLEGYEYGETVMTLELKNGRVSNVDSSNPENNMRLSEGYYKIVESANNNKYYNNPLGTGIHQRALYFSLNDWTTNNRGQYLFYDKSNSSMPNMDGYYTKDDAPVPEGYFMNPPKGYDMVAFKVDDDYLTATDGGSAVVGNAGKVSLKSLLNNKNFGMSRKRAYGQLGSLATTKFEIINNNNEMYRWKRASESGSPMLKIGNGDVLYSTEHSQICVSVVCVDYLREMYNSSRDTFLDDAPLGENGDWSGIYLASTGGSYSHNSVHPDGKGCGDKYVCLISCVNQLGIMNSSLSGSLVPGNYTLREITPGNGYNSIKDIPFTVDSSSVVVSDSGSSYISNEPVKGGVRVKKVSKSDPDENGFAPGNTSLGGAKFSVIFEGGLTYPNWEDERVNVDTGEVIGVGEEIMELTSNSNGIAESGLVLPVGKYRIKEKSPSTGMLINNTWSVEVDITANSVVDLTAKTCEEPIIRGGVSILKVDKNLYDKAVEDPDNLLNNQWGIMPAASQGNTDLTGIDFEIVNKSLRKVPPLGSDGPSIVSYNGVVGVITTKTVNNYGKICAVASTGNRDLCYGTYEIKEIKSNGKYLLTDGEPKRFDITVDGRIVNWEANGDLIAKNNPIRGGISLQKAIDSGTSGNGNADSSLASLEGAEFEIYNMSSMPVEVRGTLYGREKKVLTIKTDDNGLAETGNRDLPYGTYKIQETKAPAGLLIDDKWNAFRNTPAGYINITEDGKFVSLTARWSGEVCTDNLARPQDPLVRGGVQIIKEDAELQKSEALGGFEHGATSYAANLSDIEFTIYNISGKPADVKLTDDLEVCKIYTHWNSTLKKYTAETAEGVLAYGDYAVVETNGNDSYKASDDTVYKFEIRDSDGLVTTDANGNLLVFRDYVVRSGLNFNKKAYGTERSIRCPWIVTNKATGERHVIMTDNNGEYHSESNGSQKVKKHSENTNGNDWMLDVLEKDPQHCFTVEELDRFGQTGIWFSVGEDGSEAEVRDDLGAFVYGDYILEEVLCDINAGYKLISVEFHVESKHDGDSVDLGTIMNHGVNPSITTLARDFRTQDNISKASAATRITDIIRCSGLRYGEQYCVSGKLTDYEDEDTLLKVNGRGIRAESEAFTATKGTMDINLEYNFDATTLAGKTGVFYAYLYNVEPNGSKTLVAQMEVVDDPAERILFPEVTTEARDVYTGNSVGTNFSPRIVDTVSYNNLMLGRTYVMNGTVRDKKTGAIITTGSTSFTPENQKGSIEVDFTLPESVDGKDVVIYEDCTMDGVSVAEHADIDDEKQTIHYPMVKTLALDKSTVSHMGIVSDEQVEIEDTVSCLNLVPGVSYTIKGSLVNKDTNQLYTVNGSAVTATQEFVAESKDEEHALVFKVDSSVLAGQTLVVYEELYYGDTRVASHEDITDEKQSIHYPDLSTKAVDINTIDDVGVVGSTKIVDTVHCTNLVVGLEYTVSGVAMDKDSVGWFGSNKSSASVNFTAVSNEQDVTLVYNLDASIQDGKSLVIFEDLIYNGKVIRSHNDLNDENQTVHFPKVRTTALEDNTNSHVGTVTDETTTITDVVNLTNLVVGKKYRVSGVLMNKDTGKNFVVNGAIVTAEKEFTATKETEAIGLTFEVKTADLAGKTLVAYEDLYHNNVKVAFHADLTDEEQSIHYPELRTSAIDVNTEDEVGVVDSTSIKDTVHLENLVVGQGYTIKGILMDKATGEYLGKDKSQDEIIAETSFTAKSTEQDVEMLYTVDSSKLEGKTAVVFEDLYVNDKLVRTHRNINDVDQTVYFPKIRTTALDGATDTHVGVVEGTQTIVDTVKYENLVVGKKYIVTGKLMDKGTGNPLLENGEEIVATTEVTPTSANGTVDLVFMLSTDTLAGKTVVVYEDLYHNNIKVTTHSEINDEEQSVHYPEVRTTAVDDQTTDEVGVVGQTTITDTVHLTNLVPNQSYTISGVVMDKETKEYLGKDLNKPRVEATKTFTATSATMVVPMTYTVDASLFENKTSVVFEDLLVNGVVVRRHEDFEDKDQTTYFPKIRTNSVENNTETKVGTVTEKVTTITDTVTYNNLVVGKEYTVSGVLMRKDTNETYLVDGKEVTSSKTFTPETASGTIDLVFTLKTPELAEKTLVVYEDLLHNGVVVTTHSDITDEDQSTHYPELVTSAIDGNTTDEVGVVGNTEIKDTVHLTNLIPGQEYVVKGVLMDKGTREYLGKDKDKPEIKQEQTFTAESATQDIVMSYPVDASLFEDKTSVVFENLYVNGKLVRTHENFADRNQTTYFPKIRTNALEDNTQTRVGTVTEEYTTITDTVTYSNLVPGKEYTLKGTLMRKDTNEIFYVDGKPVTAERTFTPDLASGSINLQFRVKTDDLAGKTLVAFEDLHHNGVKVTTHSDINDEDQSIHYPEVATSAIDGSTKDNVGKVGKTTIVDIVHMTNLIPGQEYSINGILMDKATKEYLGKDLGLSEIKAFTTFTAEAETQDVKMTFEVDASLFEDKTSVVFEDLIVNSKVVRRHEDINDEGQTTHFPKIRTTMVSEFGLKDVLVDKQQTLIDTVPYSNLVVGKEYTINGKLMNKATGEPLLVNGEEVTATDTFTAESATGERKLTFVIKDASALENVTTVAFEELVHNKVVVTTHSLIDDYEQTVRFPKVRTFALDAKTDLDEGLAEKDAGIVDTVHYDNLEEGGKYIVSGTIMDKATGEPLIVDGKGYGAATEFTVPRDPANKGKPKAVSGEVKVTFGLDASTLEGRTVVIYEKLTRNGVLVGKHEDINDENQDIKYIKIRTTAIDADTGVNDSDPYGERVIVDTVKYENATIGNIYTLKATLVDKETNKPLLVNGEEIHGETTFVAESVNGEVDVRFTVDASALEGKTVVAYENMYRSGKLVAVHADINDEDQSIHFPKVRTLAVHNDTVFNEGLYGNNITLVDSVSYENLKQGREYNLKATIMDKATGEPFLVEGNPVVATLKFTAGDDGTPVYGGAAIKSEAPEDDKKVDIGEPPIEGAEPPVEEPEVPEVKESTLRPDHGTVFDNLEELPDGMSSLKEEYTVNDEGRVTGTINVPITFNSTALAGKDIVVYEELFVNDKRVGHHTDIEDENQTIGFPSVETTATDGENKTHEQQQQKDAVIVDLVEYTNLTVGKEYTVNGVLMDKETNEPILVNGEKVKASTTFTAEEEDGAVEIVFMFDSSALAGHDLVAFEEIRRDGRLVAVHTDIEDDNQTVDIIDIKTLAVDRKTLTHEQQAATDVGIIDTVSYTNLMAGEEYVLTGVLMNKNTGEQLFINDLPVEGSTTFTPEERDGEVKVEFAFNSEGLEGIDTVVYEQLWHNGVLVATHADIEDEGQTVDIITIRTNATDAVNGTHEHQAAKEAVIYDDVTYTNLVVGKEYEVKGILMDKDTGEPLLVNGKEVKASTVFTPTERNGVVRVEFKLDSSALAGKTVVVFEDLYRDGVHIATHANIEDLQQTIEVIDIATTATDELTGTHEQQVGNKVTITDWVEYTNLEVGKKYAVKGTLMDKSTGKPLKVKGSVIKSKATFIPEEPNGSISLEFSFDSRGLAGKRLVVFENLIRGGVIVATHSDIDDEGQTVNVIDVKTNAVSKETKTHEQQINKKTTIVDTVSYTGLTKGKKYTVKGILMNQKTGKALKVKGKKVTAEKTFRAKGTEGTVKLEFTFNSEALEGVTVVVFEDLYRNNIKIATHSDIEDKNQSVGIIDIGTIATDKQSSSHTVTLGDNVVIVDTVDYTGLTPGKKYTLKGTLVDKSNKSVVAEATATFKPDKKNGSATVEFTINSNSLQGKTLVAFEKLYDRDDVEIATHEDLDDTNQTVVVPVAPGTPKTNDIPWILLVGILCIISGSGIYLLYRRANKEKEATESTDEGSDSSEE